MSYSISGTYGPEFTQSGTGAVGGGMVLATNGLNP